MPPIHDSAGIWNLVEVRRLVEQDPGSVRAVGRRGWLPLHVASRQGEIAVVLTLLAPRAGDTNNQPTRYGEDAWLLASSGGPGHVRPSAPREGPDPTLLVTSLPAGPP